MANTTSPITDNGNGPDAAHAPPPEPDAPRTLGARRSALLALRRATERQPLVAVGVGIALGYVLARVVERMRHV